MKFLKRIFVKKQKGAALEDKQFEEDIEATSLVCEYCKMFIHKDQKVKTFNGKKYHLKPCWRNLQKDVKKQSGMYQ